MLMRELAQKIAGVSYKIWLALFIVSAIICVLALRHNNEQMVKLRNAVYAADKNNGNINAALNKLRDYVTAHMNTDLSSGNNNIKPPIQLTYTYNRLREAQLNQIQTNNQQLYTQAQNYCQAQPGASGLLINGTVPCVQNYLANHGTQADSINIPAGLYEFDFVSPKWSPDLAGWSLLASVIFLIGFILRFGFDRLAAKRL